ncbi:integrator complex subunit 8-like [Stylophora pistillata]|uniref:integrator complex subunit 8-like n=1 Tax=Stylophora pistillata TaxID=50429 RepID=UPI000C03A633|nr:integrator complex subunit 8-like [Stylophora pistillata]
MATSNSTKRASKTTISWFEFLFDKTGDLLKNHLEEVSAEPSATQLIVQFLEHSGLVNNNVGAASETPPTKNKPVQRIRYLALMVGTHLQWNLEILEENLSLQWQSILLGELTKRTPGIDEVLKSDTDIRKLDKKTAMTLIIYYRWLVRTLSQHFLPTAEKPPTNGLTAADNLPNEGILRKLEEQLPFALQILEQALGLTEDMVLPSAPSLVSEPKTTDPPDQEKASEGGVPPSDDQEQNMEIDVTNSRETESKEVDKNGSDDKNGSIAVEYLYSSLIMEDVKIRKEDIIAQVSFDLGTLYFYQEKFQQAMKLFESCKNAQCDQSSFYTVCEKKLYGYYMACCGLTGIPSVAPSTPTSTENKPSLAVRLEQCRHSGYNNVVAILLEDNIALELPLEYRENLVAELRTNSRRMSEDEESIANISLDWQVMVCNIIRDILEGRPTNPGFWLSLGNCTQNQLDIIFSLCLQSVPIEDDFPPQGVQDSDRFKILKSFIQMICCTCEQVDGWKIARNCGAKIFLDEEVEEPMDDVQIELVNTKPDVIEQGFVTDLYNTEAASGQESTELKKGFISNKLRHSVDPGEISNLVEELHQLEKGRKHSEEFVCPLYKSHLEEIKSLQQQDILHILFSKALHCSAVQEYNKASQLLSYALGMVNTVAGRGAVNSPLEKVKAAIHQELLVLDICHESGNKRPDEISNRVKSYIWQTAPGAAEVHIEEQVNAFLLNGKEWEFLSEIKVDENAQSVDHRSLSSLLASACYYLSKPQGWRKPARSLWDGVLKIFSNSNGQQKRPADGSQGAIAPQSEGLKL